MEEKTILAGKAPFAQDWFNQSAEFFFPPKLKRRFDAIASEFALQPPDFWNDHYIPETRERLRQALAEMEAHLAELDCTDFLANLDDTLFFFYVLKMQSAWVFLLALDAEQYVPGELPQLWKWMTQIPDTEGWFNYVLPTAWELRKLKVEPPLWGIPFPKGFEEDMKKARKPDA